MPSVDLSHPIRMSRQEISLLVNGEEVTTAIEPSWTLLRLLRDGLALNGAKRGCNQGVCGACTVIQDGYPVRSCLTLAQTCEGTSVGTVEGLSQGDVLAPIQDAFVASGAVQCGFCTSGMLLVASAFLAQNPRPTRDDIRAGLAGNLCRCTGYRKIVEAVHAASLLVKP